MNAVGKRMIIVGIILVLLAGSYLLLNIKSTEDLRTMEARIQFENMIARSGEIEKRTATEIYHQKLGMAYWPAGIGALFILCGWTLLPAKKSDSSDA